MAIELFSKISAAFSKKIGIVAGLDLGSKFVKLARIEKVGDQFILRTLGMKDMSADAITSKEIRDPDAVIMAIQTLVEQCDRNIKGIVLSICGKKVITDMIQVDVKKPEQAEQAILFEAEQRFPTVSGEITLDWFDLGAIEGTLKRTYLLVAARNDYLLTYHDVVKDALLRVVIIDSDYFALFNAFEANYNLDVADAYALANIGHELTQVTFVESGKYHSAREISSGARDILLNIERECGLSGPQVESLASGQLPEGVDELTLKAGIANSIGDLKMGLDMVGTYFENSSKVGSYQRLYLAGGGALIPFLPEILQDRIMVPTEVMNPLRRISFDPEMFPGMKVERIAPVFTIAIGLALRATEI